MKNHNGLFSGATRQFGTWSKALRAAGVPEMQTSGYPRLRILKGPARRKGDPLEEANLKGIRALGQALFWKLAKSDLRVKER